MGRVAGDNPNYTFRLMQVVPVRDGSGELTGETTLVPTEDGFELPSVTTILDDILGKPAGAMAHWGYYLGLEGVVKFLEESPAEALAYTFDNWKEELKEAGFAPNKVKDAAASRGSAAHEVGELLFAGDYDLAEAKALEEEAEQGTKYGRAIQAWWRDRIDAHRPGGVVPVFSEARLWSLKHGYAGSADLGVDWGWGTGIEIVDFKTHKPASGFTIAGLGPAYFSDVVQCRAYRVAHEEMGLGPTAGNRIVVARENGEYLEDTREVSEVAFLNLLAVREQKQQFEQREED